MQKDFFFFFLHIHFRHPRPRSPRSLETWLKSLELFLCFYQCCMDLAVRLQYWELCSSTNVNLCSAGKECEGERSGCPRIPARWKPIHSERHSGYRGRSQTRWGWACGREEWWRESFLCLQALCICCESKSLQWTWQHTSKLYGADVHTAS